jgi:hypothetical protein
VQVIVKYLYKEVKKQEIITGYLCFNNEKTSNAVKNRTGTSVE